MRAPNPGNLNRRVHLCSAKDVVTENGVMLLNRTDVRAVWAYIYPVQGNTFSRQGYNPNRWETHKLVMYSQKDIDLSSAAWVYEPRRISLPLWYKMGTFSESSDGTAWELNIRLYSQSEEQEPPRPSSGSEVLL